MQRAYPPPGFHSLVGVFRCGARAAFINAHERIELRIPSLDLIQMRFKQFACGYTAITNTRGHLPRGKAEQLRHGGMVAKPSFLCLCEAASRGCMLRAATEWRQSRVSRWPKGVLPKPRRREWNIRQG